MYPKLKIFFSTTSDPVRKAESAQVKANGRYFIKETWICTDLREKKEAIKRSLGRAGREEREKEREEGGGRKRRKSKVNGDLQ